jgi:hypothetical protein
MFFLWCVCRVKEDAGRFMTLQKSVAGGGGGRRRGVVPYHSLSFSEFLCLLLLLPTAHSLDGQGGPDTLRATGEIKQKASNMLGQSRLVHRAEFRPQASSAVLDGDVACAPVEREVLQRQSGRRKRRGGGGAVQMVNPLSVLLSPCGPRRYDLGSTETPCVHARTHTFVRACGRPSPLCPGQHGNAMYLASTHSTHKSQRASAHVSSAPHRCDAELRAAVRVNPERGLVAPGAWAARLRRHLKGRAGATQRGPGLAECLDSAATHACGKGRSPGKSPPANRTL